MSDRKTTLKPCPFCGEIPSVDYEARYYGVDIFCKKCRISEYSNKGIDRPIWNNRPEEDRLRAEMKRLKAENADYIETIEHAHQVINHQQAENERLQSLINDAPMINISDCVHLHPTCKTCEINDNCDNCEQLRVTDIERTYSLDFMNTEAISYCSAHTALKKATPRKETS